MKRPTLKLNKFENKHFLIAWIVFHAALVSFFVASLLAAKGHLQIDADLFNMFPKSFEEESIRRADDKMTLATGDNVFILVSNASFDVARKVAVQVYDSISASDNFKSVSLYNGMDNISEITDFVYDYRWNLLDDETIDFINSPGGAEIFAQNALAQAYGAFTMLSLDNLDTDPFMLAEHNLNNYLAAVQKSGVAMSVKDGVLATQYKDNWFIMIRGVLSKKGAALATKNNGVGEIYRVCEPLEKDGTRFVYSGTPFHSYASSNSASKEITIIGVVSLLAVIVILLLVFHTPMPIFFSVGSILVSVLIAFLTTLATFKKMHVLTLVFGTSLIGSCIDYSIHYFTHWAGNGELKSGKEIREKLLPGLTMAIISTSFCFAILLFAPFTLLKQMALFSVTGLISAFLTTVAIYPYIPLPKGERKIGLLEKTGWFSGNKKSQRNRTFLKRIPVIVMFVASIIVLLVCGKRLRIKNDLTKLYTMQGRLKNDTIEAAQIIQYSPTGWFIVRGDSEDEVLQREESLRGRLEGLPGEKFGYLSPTMFIPSIEKQKQSRSACEKLLALADEQLEYLGFEDDEAEELRKAFKASEKNYISVSAGNVPQFLMDSISTAWLGEINGKYYTVLVPSFVFDTEVFKNVCKDDGDLFYVSKASDISADLDHLTKMVLNFFLIAYVAMFVMLKFFYSWKQALKIISIPVLIMLITATIFALCKINLEFFSVTGIILVFGLGLDYIIYMMENERAEESKAKQLEPFAILLSFLTTIISFGALALSSFMPVHLIGLAIFVGLATAYFASASYR